jgi:hypothetical protein
MLLHGESPEEMEREENVWRLLSKHITRDDTEVIRAVVYSFHALIAKDYRRGRAFILGDAAHQMPPFLGQGMCAGIRDAANLAWKLDLVRSGMAGDSLLDTYYEERAPHVRAIIARAVAAGRIIQTTDPNVAAGRDAMFLAAEKKEIIIGESGGGLELKMPALTEGIPHGAEPGGIVGNLFPQPFVERAGKQVRLDDLYSGRFAIVAGPDAPDLFTNEVIAAWHDIGAAFLQVGGDFASPPWPLLQEQGDQLASLLRSHGAIVVRPDLYIYGTAKTASGLVALADALLAQLSIREKSATIRG